MVSEILKYKIIRLIIINLLLTIMLFFNFSANAAEPKRIALLPFKINAEKDMSFLQNGIFDMLTSRLSKEGEVEVIGRQEAESAFKAAGSPDPVTESVAPKELNHYNRVRSATITANLAPGKSLGEALDDLDAIAALQDSVDELEDLVTDQVAGGGETESLFVEPHPQVVASIRVASESPS